MIRPLLINPNTSKFRQYCHYSLVVVLHLLPFSLPPLSPSIALSLSRPLNLCLPTSLFKVLPAQQIPFICRHSPTFCVLASPLVVIVVVVVAVLIWYYLRWNCSYFEGQKKHLEIDENKCISIWTIKCYSILRFKFYIWTHSKIFHFSTVHCCFYSSCVFFFCGGKKGHIGQF